MYILGNERTWEWGENIWKDKSSVEEDLESLEESNLIFIDTETTGLKWMLNDKPFSIALKTRESGVYYINLKNYPEEYAYKEDFLFKDFSRLEKLFSQERTWVAHNLKFDWHMLRTLGFTLKGNLQDTMVRERICSNDETSYSLENCVKRNLSEYKKDDTVEKYIAENGLYRVEDVEGKNKKFTIKFYDRVPFHIIAPYAMTDVIVTQKLYESQEQRLSEVPVSQKEILDLESAVLRECCLIEEQGVLVDKEYCEKAIAHEEKVSGDYEDLFKQTYGMPFIDSAKTLSPHFLTLGITPPKTDKNNDSIDSNFLSSLDTPLANLILKHRESKKRENTYFRSFLQYSDFESILHADMRQAGTRTGRFSYMDPNLQNLPTEDGSIYPVRRAIVPRQGNFFLMIDYSQQEFRMMLDYAGEMELIEKIKQGHDPHQATADLTGLDRKAAKSLNFGLMYGMGIQKLADQIGVTYEEAKEFKRKYFQALPKVKQLIYSVTDTAKARGYLFTKMKRKLDFKNPDFAYKGINAIIQGGCAEVTKQAMVECAQFLKDHRGRLVLQIHDELVFELPYEEVYLSSQLKRIMDSVYKCRYIPLTTSMSYSLKSLHDDVSVKETSEIASAIREFLEKEGKKISGETSKHVVCENPAT